VNSDSAQTQLPGERRVGLAAYTTLCTAVVAIVFLTNWPTYDYAVRGGPIPLYYYLLPALFVVPVIFAAPATAVRFMREPLFWWFAIFVATGFVWLLLAQDFVEDASRQWRLRVLAFMFFYTVTLLSSEAHRRVIGWVIVACVLVACAFNWFDVLRPYRFVPQGVEGATEGRGAGLFINPNAAGSFIVMGTLAALPMIPARFRGLFLITAVFGVAATFSRGAFVMISVVLLGAIWLKLVKRAQGVVLILTLPLLILGVGLSYDYLAAASENRSMNRVVERLNWFKAGEEEDEAVEGRRYGASQAWQLFLDKPVTGHGPGVASLAVRQEGPHNMYLLLMAEQGILGFILYVSLFVAVMRRGRRIARAARTMHERDLGNTTVLCGVFLAAYGFFSHNVLEEPHTIFLLAFIVATGFAGLRVSSGGVGLATPRADAKRRMSSAAG
jgi:O-antigen ligase